MNFARPDFVSLFIPPLAPSVEFVEHCVEGSPSWPANATLKPRESCTVSS